MRDAAAVRELLARVRPDVVIHTAYRQDGDLAREIVVDGSENVARASVAVGARLIHLSTDVVFDGRKGSPYVEDDLPSPCTAYGRAKAEAELRVAAVAPDALIVRTSLIVGGPGHEPSKHELVAHDPAATFYDDEIRSPIQVGDLAAALLELAALDVSGPLNVAGADDVSRAELAELVAARPVRRVERTPRPPARLRARLVARPRPAADGLARCPYGLRMNRLAAETSPYLLQHADNPVDWYPWGPRRSSGRGRRTGRSCCRSATAPATGAT